MTHKEDTSHLSGRGMTRRQFLIGGSATAALAAAAGVVAGRSWTVRDYWWRLTGAWLYRGNTMGSFPHRIAT
jgi:hypothetical protein